MDFLANPIYGELSRNTRLEARRPSRRLAPWTRQEVIVAWMREEILEREKFIDFRCHLKTEPTGHVNGSEVKDKRENP